MTAAVELLRWVAFVIACYNLTWTWQGARELARGSFRPPEMYLSVLFLFSWMAISFQLAHQLVPATERPSAIRDLWRLFSFTLLIVAHGLAAAGHRLGATIKARQFYGVYDHLDMVLAIVGLARIDPAAAAAMAADARRQTAAKMLVTDV